MPLAAPGTVRGGDLQYTIPSTWTAPWDSTSMPYMDEIGAQARNVEGNWYSAVSLGRVVFPEDEGGYPGLEPAAVYAELTRTHGAPRLRGPFNLDARRAAGFTAGELEVLQADAAG